MWKYVYATICFSCIVLYIVFSITDIEMDAKYFQSLLILVVIFIISSLHAEIIRYMFFCFFSLFKFQSFPLCIHIFSFKNIFKYNSIIKVYCIQINRSLVLFFKIKSKSSFCNVYALQPFKYTCADLRNLMMWSLALFF